MKGQEVLSVILISGILIGVVGSVYFWGVPLIQKNKDISTLESAEEFMKNLNYKIKNAANVGGRDRILMTIPNGMLTFDGTEINLVIDTEGVIYAANAEIPLGKNYCSVAEGMFGIDEPETLCVRSQKIGENAYRTTYTLKYITLKSSDVLRDFQISLMGNTDSGSKDSTIIIDSKGTTSTPSNSRTLLRSLVEISII